MPATPAMPATMAVVMLVLFISTLLDRPQGFVLCAATAQLAEHTRLDPVGFGNSAGMLRQSFNQSNTFGNILRRRLQATNAPAKNPFRSGAWRRQPVAARSARQPRRAAISGSNRAGNTTPCRLGSNAP